MWHELFLIWLGMALMALIIRAADRRERRRIVALAEAVCTDKEEVQCYNATVIAAKDGTISWFDNERIELL